MIEEFSISALLSFTENLIITLWFSHVEQPDCIEVELDFLVLFQVIKSVLVARFSTFSAS